MEEKKLLAQLEEIAAQLDIELRWDDAFNQSDDDLVAGCHHRDRLHSGALRDRGGRHL